jgi:hypothetical protein
MCAVGGMGSLSGYGNQKIQYLSSQPGQFSARKSRSEYCKGCRGHCPFRSRWVGPEGWGGWGGGGGAGMKGGDGSRS